MKVQIDFNFKSGDSIKFSFDLNELNKTEIAVEMAKNFEKKVALLNCKASKYFKKSSVLSHRRFEMSIYLENVHVRTVFAGIGTGNAVLKDNEALIDLLSILLGDITEKPSQITEIA